MSGISEDPAARAALAGVESTAAEPGLDPPRRAAPSGSPGLAHELFDGGIEDLPESVRQAALALVEYGDLAPAPVAERTTRGPVRVHVPLTPLGTAQARGEEANGRVEPGGRVTEVWTSTEPAERWRVGRVELASTSDWTFGAVHVDEADLERDVAATYDDVLASLEGARHPHLVRMWNVLSDINRTHGPVIEGLDRYMGFCRARSLAFERHHGGAFARRLSAASAVGGADGPLVVYFLARAAPGESFGNPRQEEAFRYPTRYGPRPPSFARATRVAWGPGAGASHLFVSGTASIVGSESVHLDDYPAQLLETERNLEAVAVQARADVMDAPWSLKVYLKDARDLDRTRMHLRDTFGPNAPMLFLHADVCRDELAVEIEAIVSL